MKYRPEVDGLRAVAILPVVLFHAGIAGIPGGFVGVDVFFVISGYLITSLILEEIENGRFSFAHFYERRARRILPALYVMLVVSILPALYMMLPDAFSEFSHSLGATAIFLSNVHFWENTGYFATEAELQPLLHTWSLAVEEQFYLIFPGILLLAMRFGRSRAFWGLVMLALASLLLSEWGWRNHRHVNFFFTFSRFWELLAGVLCAFLIKAERIRNPGWPGLLGLVMILAAVVFYDKSVPFPSLHALLPVGGAVLVILFAAPENLAGRLLATRPMVAVGLVSYSLYLWHQPIFSFARIYNFGVIGLATIIACLAATGAAGYLSWRFVEQPLRRPALPALKRRGTIFALSGAGAALLFSLGLVGMETGASWRSDKLPEIVHKLRKNNGLARECNKQDPPGSPACRTSDAPEVLVWGDSYAKHLVPAILAGENPPGIVQLTSSSCTPIAGFSGYNPTKDWQTREWAEDCALRNSKILDYVISSPSIRLVVMGSPFGDLSGRGMAYFEGEGITDSSHEKVATKLRKTLEALRAAGKTAVLVAPPARNGTDIGNCLAMSEFMGRDLDNCNFRLPPERLNGDAPGTYRNLRAFKDMATLLWLPELTCEMDGRCRSHADGVYLYKDTGHLSVDGAAWLGEQFGFRWVMDAFPQERAEK